MVLLAQQFIELPLTLICCWYDTSSHMILSREDLSELVHRSNGISPESLLLRARLTSVLPRSGIMWSIERDWLNLFLINTMCHIYRCMEKEAQSTVKAVKSPWAVAVLWGSRLLWTVVWMLSLPFSSANMIFSLCRSRPSFYIHYCKVRHLITWSNRRPALVILR